MSESFPTDVELSRMVEPKVEAAGIEPARDYLPKYAISRPFPVECEDCGASVGVPCMEGCPATEIDRESWERINDDWRRKADLRYAQELLRWSRSLEER